MSKRSKVTGTKFDHEWQGKEKMMYDHRVAFENGDAGMYSTDKQEQTTFVEGQEAEYDIEEKDFRGQKQYKIKAVRKFGGGGGGGGGAPRNDKCIAAQNVLGHCTQLFIAGKLKDEHFFGMADKMYAWVAQKGGLV